jgi:ketosteroid isomerase-like protein
VPTENIQIVRQAFHAFVLRDVKSALRVMDADVDFSAPGTQRLAGREPSYHGHDGVQTYFEDVANVWEELEVFLHEYHEVDDERVLVAGRVRAQAKDGRIVDQPAQWAWAIKDGKIVWGRVFTDRKQALRELELAASVG